MRFRKRGHECMTVSQFIRYRRKTGKLKWIEIEKIDNEQMVRKIEASTLLKLTMHRYVDNEQAE